MSSSPVTGDTASLINAMIARYLKEIDVLMVIIIIPITVRFNLVLVYM